MRRIATVFLVGAMSSASGLFAQDPPPVPPAQETAPEPPPRVVGQAQSQEELDAWNAIEVAATLVDKEKLAAEFLTAYPDSGLTCYVHFALAASYRQANENEKFIEHAEKALVELPNLPEVSSYLAFLYAETGKSAEAARRAQQTLDAVEGMERPDRISAANWARSNYRSRGDAYYALGRVNLEQAMGLEGEAEEAALAKAVDYLEKAIGQDPENPYASFRLGQAYTNSQQLEKAIDAYARTVALGGMIEPYARASLEKIYQHVHNDMSGLEGEITEQRQALQANLEGRRKELLELEQAEQAAAAQSGSETVVRPPF